LLVRTVPEPSSIRPAPLASASELTTTVSLLLVDVMSAPPVVRMVLFAIMFRLASAPELLLMLLDTSTFPCTSRSALYALMSIGAFTASVPVPSLLPISSVPAPAVTRLNSAGERLSTPQTGWLRC
jgi:hypothetical protein